MGDSKNDIKNGLTIPKVLVPVIFTLIAALIAWNGIVQSSLADRPIRNEVQAIIDREAKYRASKEDVVSLRKDVERLESQIKDVKDQVNKTNAMLIEVLKEVRRNKK